MLGKLDYSILDRPEIQQFVFYPRQEWTSPPPGARDYMVPVADGVSISCRFYPAPPGSPCILFFHGNGEVACDYDGIAPAYNQEGIGLFVADYRGYGRSGDTPSFSALVADAHPLFHFFVTTVHSTSPDSALRQAQDSALFVMGRSLGSHCAVELAGHYPQQLRGLILESGSANMARLLRRFGFWSDPAQAVNLEGATAARIAAITLPVLIIHGQGDELIPVSEAQRFYETVGSRDKRLVIIPGAGHNDLMLVGMEPYFTAIRQFVVSGGQGK